MNHIKPDDAFEDHIKKPEYRRVRSMFYIRIQGGEMADLLSQKI